MGIEENIREFKIPSLPNNWTIYVHNCFTQYLRRAYIQYYTYEFMNGIELTIYNKFFIACCLPLPLGTDIFFLRDNVKF